jgi:hypothetical protein
VAIQWKELCHRQGCDTRLRDEIRDLEFFDDDTEQYPRCTLKGKGQETGL